MIVAVTANDEAVLAVTVANLWGGREARVETGMEFGFFAAL